MDVQQETRISQFLPTVKCIDCGRDIEANLLSEHECAPAPDVPPLPAAYQNNVFNTRRPGEDVKKQNPWRPELNPIAVAEPSAYDSYSRPPRSPRSTHSQYDGASSPTDSGYSSMSGKHGNLMPADASRPSGNAKPQMAFMQKYKMANKLPERQVTSPSPIENSRQDYYNGGYVETPQRSDSRYPPKSNMNLHSDNKYDQPRDRYGEEPSRDPYGKSRGLYDQDRSRDPHGQDKYRDPYGQPSGDRSYDWGYGQYNRYQPDADRDRMRWDRETDRSRAKSPGGHNVLEYSGSSNQPYGGNSAYEPASAFSSERASPYDRTQPMHKPSNELNSSLSLVSADSNVTGRARKINGDHGPIDDLVEDLIRTVDGMSVEKSAGKSQYNPPHSRSKSAGKNLPQETCAYCNGPITTSPSWALGKAWHPHHLLCADCKKPIDPNESFVPHNEKVYCLKDFEKIAYPPCRSCGLPVKGQAVSSGDGKLKGKWHLECFGCHTCHMPFPDKSFYVFNNAPYCKRHYHKLNNSLCRKCDEPIEGPCAQTVEGWRYHPGCFVCFICRSPLADIYYSFEDNQYCEVHIMEIQRQRKIRAEKRQTMFRNI